MKFVIWNYESYQSLSVNSRYLENRVNFHWCFSLYSLTLLSINAATWQRNKLALFPVCFSGACYLVLCIVVNKAPSALTLFSNNCCVAVFIFLRMRCVEFVHRSVEWTVGKWGLNVTILQFTSSRHLLFSNQEVDTKFIMVWTNLSGTFVFA
jgi:hypothetical protein